MHIPVSVYPLSLSLGHLNYSGGKINQEGPAATSTSSKIDLPNLNLNLAVC